MLHCSHFWNDGAYPGTRFDPENCDAICYPHHFGSPSIGWEYRKAGEYRDWKMRKLGQQRYDDMEKRARFGSLRFWTYDIVEELRQAIRDGNYEAVYKKHRPLGVRGQSMV